MILYNNYSCDLSINKFSDLINKNVRDKRFWYSFLSMKISIKFVAPCLRFLSFKKNVKKMKIGSSVGKLGTDDPYYPIISYIMHPFLQISSISGRDHTLGTWPTYHLMLLTSRLYIKVKLLSYFFDFFWSDIMFTWWIRLINILPWSLQTKLKNIILNFHLSVLA